MTDCGDDLTITKDDIANFRAFIRETVRRETVGTVEIHPQMTRYMPRMKGVSFWRYPEEDGRVPYLFEPWNPEHDDIKAGRA